jgi:hypothetical protein
VALWFDAKGVLTSDIGAVESSIVIDDRVRHCAGREYCRIVREPLGRRVLVSRKLLDSLRETWTGSAADGAEGTMLRLEADHVGDGGPARWLYQVFPVRWRGRGPADHIDPRLMLAVWPD